ncbi:bacterio-opsin activator domain-containing protein [Halobaculum limi]|uniref:bacterio-opsin activator domain-containing protein n=1 Tax=Halobaculum limi TaxID=3031916 RepID=UPI002405FDD2|nr:bacterio-opsin activator domain-containing protein [Halobaculum sp. YSMS11]
MEVQGGNAISTVLDAFDTVETTEPMSTVEVAMALGVSRGVAYAKLDAAADAGLLESKKSPAGSRIWWAPVPRATTVGSERMLELGYRSRALASPFLGLFDREWTDDERDSAQPTVHASVDSVVTLRDGVLHYYTVHGVSASSCLETLRAIDGVTRARLLSTGGDVTRVEVRLESDRVSELFARFDGSVTRAELVDNEVHFVGTVPGTANVRAVTDAVVEAVPDAELVRQRVAYTPRLIRDIVTDALSEQQRASLEAAYHGGYFSVPRESTGAEIAESLGVTRQTFNHHLRRAELAVVDHLFSATAEDAL